MRFAWKAIQNAGFRVAIAGGSDWLCIPQSSQETPRTDAIIDGDATYTSWLGAIKAGRTAVANANGPGGNVALRVEGVRIGDELRLDRAQDVTVAVETSGPEAADVEVLVNGIGVSRVALPAGTQLAQSRIHVERSSWVSLRSDRVLTSPVYVLVAGQPIRASSEDVCYLARSVADLRQKVTSGAIRLGESQAESVAAYDEAFNVLQSRFREAGGQTCP